MKKALAGGLAVIAVLLIGTFAGAARATEGGNFDCSEAWSLCAEPESSIGYNGAYTGHDEPSLLFYSSQAGSGNSSMYQMTVPQESRVMPNQAGTGGTWNFQLHPAFWFGMALCDNQSAPEYTHAPCVADSDTNIADGSDPNAADYIGKHTGTAFLELQFYPPGWAPWPPGVSCDATKWCAAMAIFSLNNDYNHTHPEQRGLPEHGRDRAGELRVRHALGDAARAAEPARGDQRHVHSALVVRSVHERGRQAGHRHPRQPGRSGHGHQRPDDRPDGIDDSQRSERVRADQLRSGRRHVLSEPVRVPSDVLHVE